MSSVQIKGEESGIDSTWCLKYLRISRMKWKREDISVNLAYRLCLFKLHVIANHKDTGQKTKVKGETAIVVMTEANCACS